MLNACVYRNIKHYVDGVMKKNCALFGISMIKSLSLVMLPFSADVTVKNLRIHCDGNQSSNSSTLASTYVTLNISGGPIISPQSFIGSKNEHNGISDNST